jgi:hypothetical protein
MLGEGVFVSMFVSLFVSDFLPLRHANDRMVQESPVILARKGSGGQRSTSRLSCSYQLLS